MRAGNACKLCAAANCLEHKAHLSSYEVPESPNDVRDTFILACKTCTEQLNDAGLVDVNHWRALNDSMWSPVPVLKVVVYKMLNQLREGGWRAQPLDTIYLDEETKA